MPEKLCEKPCTTLQIPKTDKLQSYNRCLSNSALKNGEFRALTYNAVSVQSVPDWSRVPCTMSLLNPRRLFRALVSNKQPRLSPKRHRRCYSSKAGQSTLPSFYQLYPLRIRGIPHSNTYDQVIRKAFDKRFHFRSLLSVYCRMCRSPWLRVYCH